MEVDELWKMISGTLVERWSRTQASRALSVAGSEYYASVTGTAGGLGMQLLLSDPGLKSVIKNMDGLQRSESDRVETRLGDKKKHTELGYLWVQEMTNSGRLNIRRECPGSPIWRIIRREGLA